MMGEIEKLRLLEELYSEIVRLLNDDAISAEEKSQRLEAAQKFIFSEQEVTQ